MDIGVYIIQSCKNGRYYIGSTLDFKKRLKDHNAGKVFSTKNTRLWVLKRFLSCVDEKEAKSNEYRLKKYKRRDILEKVIKDGAFPWNH